MIGKIDRLCSLFNFIVLCTVFFFNLHVAVKSNTEDEQKKMLQEKRFVRTYGYGDERRSMRNGFKQFFGR